MKRQIIDCFNKSHASKEQIVQVELRLLSNFEHDIYNKIICTFKVTIKDM